MNKRFRKNPVDRSITNLKTHFEQINDDNVKKQSTAKQITLTKLSEDIQQIYHLLYGTIDIEPESKNINQLIPKLIDVNNNNLFYKLTKYRTHFPYEIQIIISKILQCVIQNGGKHGIQKYIKSQTNTNNAHNKIIDALLREFSQHSGGVFGVLQEMTKRTDLTSMLLNKIKINPIQITKSRYKIKHHKTYSFQDNAPMIATKKINNNNNKIYSSSMRQQHVHSNTIDFGHNYDIKNKAILKHEKLRRSTNIDINGSSQTHKRAKTKMETIHQNQQFKRKNTKHYKNNTAPILRTKCINDMVAEREKEEKQKEYNDKIDDVSFVDGLFILVESQSLHISLDAFKTLKYLFIATNNNIKDNDIKNEKIYKYFYENGDYLFIKFNKFIKSDNTVNKRQFFNLLNELLFEPNNFDILMKYITKKGNLSITKRILTDEFIISQTDDADHNAIIDTLLEEYFEEASDILQEIASRPTLSDLLLNHTFITRLEEQEQEQDDDAIAIDIDEDKEMEDMKMRKIDEKHTSKIATHKDLTSFLGITSPTTKGTMPCLQNMGSISSVCSDTSSYITTPGGTIKKTRYSGDDIPCFKRSPQRFSDIKERSFIMELICLINRSCSHLVATYSFNVLQSLLTVNKEKASIYLTENYEKLIIKFRKLININNSNKLRQKEFLGLLCELLLESKNSKFRKQFKSQIINLKIIMNLLKSNQDIVVYDAFQIFAIFVTSKQKTREIHVVLWKNTKQNNLIQFIENLLINVKYEKYKHLDRQKQTVINYLQELPTPKSDEEYMKIINN